MKTKITFMLYIVFILLIGFTMLTEAQSYTFQQNEYVNFRFRCLDQNNSYCTSTTILLISIEAPNGTNAINNQTMTFNPTFYNFSLPTASTGTYSTIIISPTSNGTLTEFSYIVNPLGKEFTTAQAILYLVIIFIALSVFSLSLFGAINLPFRNTRNEDGKVISMNDLKYIKIFLWFFTYVVVIWIIAIAKSVTQNFLFFNNAYSFFDFIYWILFSFLWPIIVIFFVFSLILFIQDKKFRNALQRGLPLK